MLEGLRDAWRVCRIFLDGFLLTCPRCHAGRLYHGFHMYQVCSICDLPFEMGAGEVTGGMGISAVATFVVVMTAATVLAFMPRVPAAWGIACIALLAVVFPILFYRASMGLWVGFLYWSGNNAEPDIHEPTEPTDE